MKFFSSTQDLLLYNHTVLPKSLSFIPFSVSHLGLKMYTSPSLGFAGGRLVILSYSIAWRVFQKVHYLCEGKKPLEILAVLLPYARCSSHCLRSHFPHDGPFRGIGSGSGPVRSVP